MLVTRVSLRDFRNYERLELELGERLTVVCGPNGAGKTNLLEGVYFGATGRSCRTSNERELPRRGCSTTRVTLGTAGDGEGHLIEVGFEPGEAKRAKIDGAPVDRLPASPARPLVSVFLPERLELIKGAPAARRSHLDQLVAALWPARAETRAAYSRALAQRNTLLARVRAGAASSDALDVWDVELARHGVQLADDRREAATGVSEPFARLALELGLPGPAELGYRPRSRATEPAELAAELRERRDADIERGFTAHGPHRDELVLRHDGEALRAYGSQGQQRIALLALLFAERELLLSERGRAPLMLLDDVMSELDAARRERLAELLRSAGQAVITTTDADQVPEARGADVRLLEVAGGQARLSPDRAQSEPRPAAAA